MMNDRGQTLGVTVVAAIFIFIVGFLVINLLMPEVTNARINLQCSNPSAISDGTKLLCLAIDTTIPYWILLVFSLLTGAIVSRFTL
jgi:hypothetical protein